MKKLELTTVACLLLCAAAGPAAARKPLSVTVPPGPWGGLGENIRQVALSAGNALYQHCGDMSASPILLSYDGVMSLREAHDENGRVQVTITPTDTHWDWHAGQFGHMFGHVMIGHMEPFADPVKGRSPENMWFEESICAAASIFALSSMGETWKTSPPYFNWKDYAGWLTACANGQEDAWKKNQPASFPDWLKENLPAMRKNPRMGDKNGVVAGRLYPLFKAEPAGWEAVCYLRRSPAEPNESFEHYLQRWSDACPAKLKPFVAKVRNSFLTASAPAAQPQTPASTPGTSTRQPAGRAAAPHSEPPPSRLRPDTPSRLNTKPSGRLQPKTTEKEKN